MKKKKILFFAHLQDEVVDTPEDSIKEALENMGHEVIVFDEYNFDMQKLLSYVDKVDLLLFNRGGVYRGSEQDFFMSLTQLTMILDQFKCKKVCWFLDQIVSYSNGFIREILPRVDLIFVNDDTWLRAFSSDKIIPLHCGAGKERKGKKMKELENDIAFIGRVYGDRENFIKSMRGRFGNKKFKYYDNIWKKDYDNLCKSAKVLVFPRYPSDDFYWTDAIYKALSAGAFVIHPRLHDLQKEGLIEGSHYIGYSSPQELINAVKYWIDDKHKKERKTVASQGQDFVLKNLTYENRLETILKKLETCE